MRAGTPPNSGQDPFAQARFAAITQVAVFEAVNAVTGHYTPYLGTITAPPGSSVETAAIAAAAVGLGARYSFVHHFGSPRSSILVGVLVLVPYGTVYFAGTWILGLAEARALFARAMARMKRS